MGAVLEDGRVSDNGIVSPWRSTLRTIRYHADIDWRSTIWNAVALFGIGKFGAHGPVEEMIILNCALGVFLWQTRVVRYGIKILFGLAATFRGGYLIDLASTLLPTSHQALMEAEAEMDGEEED